MDKIITWGKKSSGMEPGKVGVGLMLPSYKNCV